MIDDRSGGTERRGAEVGGGSFLSIFDNSQLNLLLLLLVGRTKFKAEGDVFLPGGGRILVGYTSDFKFVAGIGTKEILLAGDRAWVAIHYQD